MVLKTQPVTAEQFDEFIQRPDLGDAIYELVCGEIVEKNSSPFASAMAGTVASYLVLFVRERGYIGYVTGAAGSYEVFDERYVPDAAYISKARQPELSCELHNPNPPELVVEVVSDEKSVDEQRSLRRKITNYLVVGTVVWVVFPVSQVVEVHAPDQPVKILRLEDTLDGGDILPGFQLPVRDIFQ
ncbi:MAG: Uma2 family endonuclease, partial [Anaerolineae bacterium]|nr:Uma2 family endonuclease [Anaerolineae bacterium]